MPHTEAPELEPEPSQSPILLFEPVDVLVCEDDEDIDYHPEVVTA